MEAAHEIYKAARPRVGDPITYEGRVVGHAQRIDSNLCWTDYDGADPLPFIWAFKDGVNAMHDWPTKCGRVSFCPGITKSED